MPKPNAPIMDEPVETPTKGVEIGLSITVASTSTVAEEVPPVIV